MVQNTQSIGNGAIVKFIRKARCAYFFAIYVKRTITIGKTAFPHPTLVRRALVYLFPETYHWGTLFAVTNCKTQRLTLDMPFGFVIGSGSRCELSAPTTAIAVRNFFRRVIGCCCKEWQLWGMILHVVSPPKTIGQAQGC